MPKILVIYDSQATLNIIRTELVHEGYTVYTSLSAADALTKIKNITFDCIIVDFEIPEINGPDFCRQLKGDDRYRHIPIIMHTVKNETRDLLEAIQAGADDFVAKNVDLSILKAKVAAMVRIKRTYDELGRLRRVEGIRQIIATYNHEFNNPLTIVIGNLANLRGTVTDEKLKLRVERAYEAAARMSELVKKIRLLRDYVDGSYGEGESLLKVGNEG
jgi:DNA-binding response OmpR family regulator